jgi:hypothetical protein
MVLEKRCSSAHKTYTERVLQTTDREQRENEHTQDVTVQLGRLKKEFLLIEKTRKTHYALTDAKHYEIEAKKDLIRRMKDKNAKTE